MKNIIRKSVAESIASKQQFFNAQNMDRIISCASKIADAFQDKKKLVLFGNGGSAADCQHIAAEFVNRFRMERRPLPAVALTTDTSVITSIGNDYSFEEIFSKQIQATGHKGDIAIAISTSGNSPNVLKAVESAQQAGMYTIGFSGISGRLRQMSDIAFCVDCNETARIQEIHILLAHIICDLTERMIFDE